MLNQLISFMAQYLFLAAPAAVVWLWLGLSRHDKRRFLLIGAVAGALTLMLAKIGAALYFDPRPFVFNQPPLFYHAADNGFPSDHALLTFLIAWLAALFNKRAGLALALLAVAVGAARVAAGVHYGVDIVGGALIAGLSVAAAVWLTPGLIIFIKPFVRRLKIG